MKKKEKSKMTKPIVLDEKISKGVDKTLIAGNSIIMTSQTVDYDEFAGKKSTTKTTSKPKQSAKTQTTSAPTKRYKVHCGGRGKTFDTLAEATAFANAKQKQTKEVYAVTEYNARSSKGKDKPAVTKAASNKSASKQSKPVKKADKSEIKTTPSGQNKSKKIEFGRLMVNGDVVKTKGDYYKMSNGIEVGIHKEKGRYYATELSTGKVAAPKEGFASTAEAINFVEKISSTMEHYLPKHPKLPASAVKVITHHEGKSMHLQGMGKVPATEAKNVKVGDVLMWNHGETETVTNIKPSKSGKTLVLDIKNDSGWTGTRRVNVDRLVSVDKHVEIKPNATKQTQANTKAKPPKKTVVDSNPKAKNVPPVSLPQSQEAQPKRRVYKSLPQNYSVVQGTVAQSDGTILIHNGKPLFKQNKDGVTEHAKDSHGKPAHKVAALIIDPKAFNQAKNAERKLVDVEIRKHNDAKGGHPHIVVDTVDGKNVSVGITHKKNKGKKHNNIPLEHNPLGGKEQSYMLKQGTVDKKENYSSTKKTGQLTETDNEKAKKIGEKAKQKELSKKK